MAASVQLYRKSMPHSFLNATAALSAASSSRGKSNKSCSARSKYLRRAQASKTTAKQNGCKTAFIKQNIQIFLYLHRACMRACAVVTAAPFSAPCSLRSNLRRFRTAVNSIGLQSPKQHVRPATNANPQQVTTCYENAEVRPTDKRTARKTNESREGEQQQHRITAEAYACMYVRLDAHCSDQRRDIVRMLARRKHSPETVPPSQEIAQPRDLPKCNAIHTYPHATRLQ